MAPRASRMLAEAMVGKPVVPTAQAGNLELMTAQDGSLVYHEPKAEVYRRPDADPAG